jgi:hypothetical protein
MVMGAVEFQPDAYIAKPFTGNLLKYRLQKAIEYFDKAYKLTPSNINICLNYVQSLLKQAQTDSNPKETIKIADNILTAMPQLTFSDLRFERYSELSWLAQLMLLISEAKICAYIQQAKRGLNIETERE